MNKEDIRNYFRTAPLPEAQTELEVATVILSMRPTEPIATPKKPGRPRGSKSRPKPAEGLQVAS
jgi:hypothetical protein